MIETAAREPKAGGNVVELKIGQFLDDLLWRKSRREKVEDVAHPNPHAPHARAPSALLRVAGDAVQKIRRVAHFRCGT